MRFKCLRCIHCCYFSSVSESPTLFPWEKRLIEKLYEKRSASSGTRFKAIDVYAKDGLCAVVLYRFEVSGFCPFYDSWSKKCLIHDVKPYACKLYPLVIDLTSGTVIVSSKCKWVEKYLKKVKQRESTKEDLVRSLFPKEALVAKEIISIYNYLRSSLESKGFKRTNDLSLCKEYIDADMI